jgi:ribosome recycling factor
MNEEVQEILTDCQGSMDNTIEAFQRDLGRVRTGRANLSILDNVKVEYYGSFTPLNQVAGLTVADPRLIIVKPWDKGLLAPIEKAILIGDVGLTPSNDGEMIRLPVPPLTGERRKDLVKQVKKSAEDAKIRIRNARRDANDMLKLIDALPEDELHKSRDLVQSVTDSYTTKVDTIGEKKEEEILEF